MIGKFFKFLVMCVVGLVAIGVGLWAIGVAVGLAILAAKIAVVGLIGYGVVKMIGGKKKKEPQISAEDRKWLES